MKKLTVCLLAGAAVALTAISCKSKAADNAAAADRPYEIVTYVYSGGDNLPDPNLVTTINYAFANINETYDGVVINNEPRFRQVVGLKQVNPDLKVVLCVGGTCRSGFVEMAADSLNRLSLAANLKHIVDSYGLDGIDFDWEFPGAEDGGTPDDKDNFTLVLQAVRNSIGPDKILSLAGGGDLPGVDTEKVTDILDYYNVMAYDLGGQAPWHHTALYRSKNTGWRSVDEVVQYYLSLGIPYDKMMLGLGFYGRGDDNYYKGWTSYRECKPYGDLTVQWDSVACVPYIADPDGNLVLGYDNPESIKIKCDYLKERGFRGAMSWRTEQDTPDYELAREVARNLFVEK